MEAAHYTKQAGTIPGNMLDYGIMELKAALEWYDRHSPGGAERYLGMRIELEKVLRAKAVELLGGKVELRHPLYFVLNGCDTTDKFKQGAKHILDESLLAYSTFTIGDSFDIPRKVNLHGGCYSDHADLKTFEDVMSNEKEYRRLMLPRKNGNYIEGQLWIPYMTKTDRIMPV